MATKNPPKPPRDLELRSATVQTTTINTIEVPCDPRDPDYSRWFDTSQGAHPVHPGNQVISLIEGAETFAVMVAAMETANSTSHYIYLLNWFADLEFELSPGFQLTAGAKSTRLIDLLSNAVSKGVQVRAMFWDQPLRGNTSSVNKINDMHFPSSPAPAGANGAAILDNNTLHFGSHHQKILIVQGGNGLITYCGGVDPNPDRISHIEGQIGTPLHDVHCEIQGAAAKDVLQIFLDRWTDHPDSAKHDSSKGSLRGLTTATLGARGDQYVQIGRTSANGSNHPGIENSKGQRFYSFAPNGERTAKQMILHAIGQAQKFIYIEDQYLVDMDASNKLRDQLPKIQRLIILIPHPDINDHPHIWHMCKRFVDNLGYGQNPKVAVCFKKPAGAVADPAGVDFDQVGTYVHAKMFVMDDKFAIIGSANCGTRSYTYDSEITAGIFDESKDAPCTLHFAHSLRIRLWADHLNLQPADVFDPIGSAIFWFRPSRLARIATFNQNANSDSMRAFKNWIPEGEAEPDGS
jgi:phosphatidylserine/phosphatidylglycerophosphate/cardiolipin synthase-like enzyme